MIRIVGVQRNPNPSKEFILLQNQGSLRATLRGHVIVSDHAIDLGEISSHIHIFSDDELIPPGMYVLLTTGPGVPRWAKTKDGALIYYSYMNRDFSMWENQDVPLHVLAIQHSFTARRDAIALVR